MKVNKVDRIFQWTRLELMLVIIIQGGRDLLLFYIPVFIIINI